jgi:F-type H+-transporting ATPase subunit b
VNVHVRINGETLALTDAEEEEGHEGDEAHAEEAEAPNPVIPEPNHLIWALGSFLALWALMKFVLLPPILKMRADREEAVLSDREAADKARQALGEAQSAYDASLAEARSEADSILDQARSEAADHREQVMGEATNAAAALRTDAASGLDSSRASAIAGMRGDVGDVAVSAASAVLGKQLDRNSQQAAIDAALSGGDA